MSGSGQRFKSSNKIDGFLSKSFFFYCIISFLLLVIIISVLLYLFPKLDTSDLFEFFIVSLNLIATLALIFITWLVYRLEGKRDLTQADEGQKEEWRLVVDRLHSLVFLIDNEIQDIRFEYSNRYLLRTVSKIHINYLLMASHVKKLEELKKQKNTNTPVGKHEGGNNSQLRSDDFPHDDKEEAAYFREERLKAVVGITRKIKKTISDLNKKNLTKTGLEQIEETFWDYIGEHYELAVRALDYFDFHEF